MRTMEEFRRFYDTEMVPVLGGFEARRRGILRRWLTIAGIVLAALVACFLVIKTMHGAVGFMKFALLGAGVVLAAGWWILTKDFKLDFKRGVIAEVVRFFDPSLRYDPQARIPENRFRESRIFLHRIDRYRGEDHVRGKIGATAIEFSEIHAEYRTTSSSGKGGRRTQWHTIFKGIYFVADFNKHFNGLTVVLPDVAERFLGFLGKKLQEMNITRPGDLIKLEDPEFEHEFVVYGDDQIEARYILSTALMRRISAFRRKTGNAVRLSFVHSTVHVAISLRRNLFEPRFWSTLLDFRLLEEYWHDLELATGIVEDLNLNTRIWTKK